MRGCSKNTGEKVQATTVCTLYSLCELDAFNRNITQEVFASLLPQGRDELFLYLL